MRSRPHLQKNDEFRVFWPAHHPHSLFANFSTTGRGRQNVPANGINLYFCHAGRYGIMPHLCSHDFLSIPETEGENGKKNWGDRFVDWIKRKYEPLLEKALNKAKIIMVVTIALLATAVFLFSRMGGEFIPQLDEGDIAFHVILQPGSSLKEGVQTSTKIEKCC